jgi:hypothetical protein
MTELSLSDTAPKKFVFILMPFSEDFDDVYKLGIKPACQAAGAYCERVDEQIFTESILDRIYSQISKADLIVADMTGRSPNVFYEVGYAHALGKNVILLTQKAEDIPFDLKHYTHIIYGGKIHLLKDELEKKLRWYLSQLESRQLSILKNLEFFFGDEAIRSNEIIHYLLDEYDEDDITVSIYLKLYAKNITDKIAKVSPLAIRVIFPKYVKGQENLYGYDIIEASDGNKESIDTRILDLLPYETQPIFNFSLYIPLISIKNSQTIPIKLSLSGEYGMVEIPFFLKAIII